MGRSNEITELMKTWMERHHEKGYKRFVYDGIVDEAVFSTLPLRVCYILKECYITESEDESKQNDIRDSIAYHNNADDYNAGTHHWIKYIKPEDNDYTYNLVENIKHEDNWYMWHRVEHLTENFWKAFSKEINSKTYQVSKYNKLISVIDLKKSNGKGKSDYKDLLRYANEDKDFLLKEIQMINPNVIYFGNTLDICLHAGLVDETKMEKLVELDVSTGFRGVYAYGGLLLVDAYHPTARGISYEDNNEVIPIFSEIFKNRI